MSRKEPQPIQKPIHEGRNDSANRGRNVIPPPPKPAPPPPPPPKK